MNKSIIIEYTNHSLEAIYHTEGRITPKAVDENGAITDWQYEYTIKDHLGNGRVYWTWNENTNQTQVLQQADYYPFGMQHAVPSSIQIGLVNSYQFNGSVTSQESKKAAGLGMERIDDFGLGIHHAFYRTYDPQTGRMMQIDPLAEEPGLISMSTYNAFLNNPVLYNDPNGDEIDIQISKGNTAIYEQGQLLNKDRTQYTGKGVKVKKDGSVKLKGFLKEAVASLDQIRTGGDIGKELIGSLETDTDNFVIRDATDEGNTTVGRVVNFDPLSSNGGPNQNGNTSRPSFIGLAHELAHAQDADDGHIEDKVWLNFSNGKTTLEAEKLASHVENQIRAENSIPLRTYYGTDNGKSVGPLLIPETSASQHFPGAYFMSLPIPYIYN